jgi:hypothetical protein
MHLGGSIVEGKFLQQQNDFQFHEAESLGTEVGVAQQRQHD